MFLHLNKDYKLAGAAAPPPYFYPAGYIALIKIKSIYGNFIGGYTPPNPAPNFFLFKKNKKRKKLG